jgi:hypothetical protein
MAPIPGSVRFTGFIAPSDSTDVYPTQSEVYNLGGFRAVANAAGRTAITAERRKEGMMVYQLDTDEYWTLIGGIADGNWLLCNFGIVPPPTPPGFEGVEVGGLDPSDLSVYGANWLWNAIFIDPMQPAPTWTATNILYGYAATTTNIDWAAHESHNSMYLGNDDGRGIRLPQGVDMAEFPGILAFQWQALGFGSDFTDAHMLATVSEWGWKDVGPTVAAANDYFLFRKKAASNKIYCEISTAATGGHSVSVDSGITPLKGVVHQYAIIIDTAAQTVEFFIDNVSVYSNSAAVLTWWPADIAAPNHRYFDWYTDPAAGSGGECFLLHDMPWILLWEQ